MRLTRAPSWTDPGGLLRCKPDRKGRANRQAAAKALNPRNESQEGSVPAE
jgi:hypothetical protein